MKCADWEPKVIATDVYVGLPDWMVTFGGIVDSRNAGYWDYIATERNHYISDTLRQEWIYAWFELAVGGSYIRFPCGHVKETSPESAVNLAGRIVKYFGTRIDSGYTFEDWAMWASRRNATRKKRAH